MDKRRWVAAIVAAGLFVWMVVLFVTGSTARGSLEVYTDAELSDTTSEQREVGCESLSDMMLGGALDWPIGDDGESETVPASSVAAASELCDDMRAGRSALISLLAAPTVVLGVFALAAPAAASRRRADSSVA